MGHVGGRKSRPPPAHRRPPPAWDHLRAVPAAGAGPCPALCGDLGTMDGAPQGARLCELAPSKRTWSPSGPSGPLGTGFRSWTAFLRCCGGRGSRAASAGPLTGADPVGRITFRQLLDLCSPWFSHESNRAKTALLGLPEADAVAPAEF